MKRHLKVISVVFAVLWMANSIDGFLHRFNPYPYYEPYRRQIFGDMTTNRIGYQHEKRFGIPFISREALISFPSVSEIVCKFCFSYFTFRWFLRIFRATIDLIGDIVVVVVYRTIAQIYRTTEHF